MDENTHRKWDVIFKWFGLLVVLGSAWWTVHKYREDRSNEAMQLEAARTKEQNAFVFQHQATLYFDASRAAATLATSNDGKALKDAGERFRQLYWGELVVVEDRRVELAMIAFQRCLISKAKDKGADCERSPVNQRGQSIDIEKLNAEVPPTLQDLSLEIGACMRTALQQGRGISFGKVEPAITTCPYD